MVLQLCSPSNHLNFTQPLVIFSSMTIDTLVARDFADYDLTFDGKPVEVTKPEAPIVATENVKLHRKL